MSIKGEQMREVNCARKKWMDLFFSSWAVIFLSSLAFLPMLQETSSIRYVIAIESFVLGIISLKMLMKKVEVVIFFLIGISGLMNKIFIDNISLNKHIYILMSIIIACFLLSSYVRSDFLKWAVYINTGIVCYRFWADGLTQRMYISSSNNYVSVYMIFISVIYYAIAEHRKDRISLFPAIMTFVVCLLGKGRGGILASLIMLVGSYIYISNEHNSARWIRRVMIYGMVLSVICLLIYMAFNFELFEDYQIFGHFKTSGMRSSGRFTIWLDYISYAFSDVYYFMFGADVNVVPSTLRHGGNPHNSFLDIHALHGFLTFCVMLYMALYSMRYAYVNKQWLYLLCFSILLLRGFTDRVFWGSAGTPIFFFFLLIPYHWKYVSRDNHKVSKDNSALMT